MSIRRRLERLEGQVVRASLPGADRKGQERRREQFAALHRNIESHRNGEESEPETSLEDERRVIEHVIPRYRLSEGWQTEEARQFLDSWEQRAKQRVQEAGND